jgi:hypothetical protein
MYGWDFWNILFIWGFYLRLAHRLPRFELVTSGSAFPPRSLCGSDQGGFGRSKFLRVEISAPHQRCYKYIWGMS